LSETASASEQNLAMVFPWSQPVAGVFWAATLWRRRRFVNRCRPHQAALALRRSYRYLFCAAHDHFLRRTKSVLSRYALNRV
jgi:hypothetical protein